MKVDAVELIGLTQCFKEFLAIPKDGCKKGNGVVLIDAISPFPDTLNHVVVRLVSGQSASQEVNIVSLGSQPRRLLIQYPLRSADDVLNGDICDKKDFHLVFLEITPPGGWDN